MKKTITTIAILFALTLGGSAQSLFQRDGDIYNGNDRLNDPTNEGPMISLPEKHGETGDQNASPLGSGVAVLIGFGAAYALGKKRREE